MFIYILLICLLIILIRFIYVIKCSTINKHDDTTPTTNALAAQRKHSVKTMIILGSGGHTAEMINIIKDLNKKKYLPRQYIIAHTDKISELKVLEVENEIKEDGGNKSYEIVKINRSRNVGQNYLTSIFTTLYSIICSIPIVYKCKPNLILCNGPGTCIPICLITLVFKIFYINVNCKIIFIESFCRIKTLSLSGKILLYFCNEFIVQWPDLMKYSKRIKYFGRLS